MSVIHNIHPQHIKDHMLWMYVVDDFIYCGCMLWVAKGKTANVLHNIPYVVDNKHMLWTTFAVYVVGNVACHPQHMCQSTALVDYSNIDGGLDLSSIYPHATRYDSPRVHVMGPGWVDLKSIIPY